MVQAIATFGLDMIEPDESALTPLNGFLAGILLAFEPAAAGDLNASYRIDIDDRRFEFAVHDGGLTAGQGPPAVTVTATAADLITARLGSTAAERKAALRRVKFDGDADAVDAMRTRIPAIGRPRPVSRCLSATSPRAESRSEIASQALHRKLAIRRADLDEGRGVTLSSTSRIRRRSSWCR